MAYILYNKQGEKKIIHHLVDCRELLATGNYFKADPTKAPEEKSAPKPVQAEPKKGTVEADKKALADALGIEQAPSADDGPKKSEERRPEDNIVYKNAGVPFSKAAQTGKK